MNDYDKIARIIEFLNQSHCQQPGLSELAELAGLSQHHFHRLFARWAGVTPKSFLQSLTMAHARDLLSGGESVLHASLDAGLSGPGRLHDLSIKLEAASPGELKSGGEGWVIQAGIGESPFGKCLIGSGPRGICHLSFLENDDRDSAHVRLQGAWPAAQIVWSKGNNDLMDQIFCPSTESESTGSPLRLFVSGSQFQLRVWRALLQIPQGCLTSYGRIAKTIGDSGAARAVGAAVGNNPIAFLIPCHRVIRETGIIGDYRWGATRKKAILAWESASKSQAMEEIA